MLDGPRERVLAHEASAGRFPRHSSGVFGDVSARQSPRHVRIDGRDGGFRHQRHGAEAHCAALSARRSDYGARHHRDLAGRVVPDRPRLRFGTARVFSRLVLGRTVFDGLAMVLFTTALIHMPLAELSAINLVSPLIITAAAVIFFGEEVGWRRWIAISVGFLGTILMIKPTPGAFNAWALLGVATAFVGVARDMITRHLDPGIPSVVISFMAAFALDADRADHGPVRGLAADGAHRRRDAGDFGDLRRERPFHGRRRLPRRASTSRRLRRSATRC